MMIHVSELFSNLLCKPWLYSKSSWYKYTDKNVIKSSSSCQEAYQEILKIKIMNLHEDVLPDRYFGGLFQYILGY